MAKLKIGNKNIAKKMLGTKEILKEVLNGVTIYEKVVGGNYITFSSPNSFTVAKNSKGSYNGTLEYSTDTTTWNTWDGTAITGVLNSETYNIYLRGSNNTYVKGDQSISGSDLPFFVLTGNDISCNGNIENLLDYQTVANGGHPQMAYDCFSRLFVNCAALISAPELPATTLSQYCYHAMFYGCTSLTIAPKLPSTNIVRYCYSNMFRYCTSLLATPKLPSSTLDVGCYESMFMDCKSLTILPKLSGINIMPNCYNQMFSGCTLLYVSDTQTAEAPYAWTIPTNGTFTGEYDRSQNSMFYNCLGTRASDNLAGEVGHSYTYYTQNPPVGD